MSDSGAGVRFVRIFGDTANNTWNPTWVRDCGVSDSTKKLRHGCPGNTVYSDSMIEMRIPSLNASETLEHAELLRCLHLHRKECQARTFVHKGLY